MTAAEVTHNKAETKVEAGTSLAVSPRRAAAKAKAAVAREYLVIFATQRMQEFRMAKAAARSVKK